MDILTSWLRELLPQPTATDSELAEALTLRGIAVEGVFPVEGGGSRFEMDITTNRVDAMNHYGVAREVAAIYELPLPALEEGIAAPVRESVAGEPFAVRIEAPDLCGRFTARVIRGVTVKPATGVIAERFAALGQKPISGPVDATNYGWLLMGQPTHVFDLDTIEGGIVVRRARAGERLRLLDGTERTLTAEDLVIADERKALSLAGVMGGWDSRVTEATKNILVEAAWFVPGAIRASSRRHGLHTDASHRYERGADFNGPPLANRIVTRLVLEQAGGEATGPMAEVIVPELQAKTAGRAPIVLRVPEVQRHLGTTLEDAVWTGGQRTSGLSENVVEQYLTALGCALAPTGGTPGEYGVTLPSWRLDLEREIDLIEEVARVYGYNRFANTLPGWAGEVTPQPHAAAERTLRDVLRGLGYSETVSSTFVSAEEAATFGEAQAGVVRMGNPLSEEAGMLRPSLLPNMATTLGRNLARDVTEVRLFELGTAFTGSAAAVHERMALVLGATGASRTSSAGATGLFSGDEELFFAVKGALETVLARWAGEVRFDAEALPAWIAPGRGARALLDGTPVAWWGELEPGEAARRKLRQLCVLADVDAQALLERPLRRTLTRELSRFQAAERDFSFVMPDGVQWEAAERAVRALAIPELTTLRPLEIFRDAKGKAVAAGSYSLLLRTVFQSAERTLTEEELIGWSERLVAALTSLGGTQRA